VVDRLAHLLGQECQGVRRRERYWINTYQVSRVDRCGESKVAARVRISRDPSERRAPGIGAVGFESLTSCDAAIRSRSSFGSGR